ncbi:MULTISPECIES: phosphatidylinositol-specific phospholipase C1-like protein [unclassified Azospirillum]|uniref:phosphatidylinositol-specific phospholipase C1-like protein n=1 Tax=unclassified Azospirillum TaxID=2630922 RepID=UPI000B651BFB|nr:MULTISPECIES: phosphatidylinositol-specific phospholipase C1-like protein [unclassified Azospirillum]SNS98086.1 Phosphoinositide phospholipase C, Ca2+-dependent [Azospirillum sp. RU38E]SNT14497.1 Phosphoinositide phospholipase C, Ca2+-dependent [Azospirillum sp. RU37A]
MRTIVCSLLLAGLLAPPVMAADAPVGRALLDNHLHMNDIVAVGTHNSYKKPLSPAEWGLLASRNQKAADSIDYGHRSLTEQLDAGVRQLELDVYHDPAGGRFTDPKGPALAGQSLPDGFKEARSQPGLKVFHIPDIDPYSQCQPFTACLAEIRRWSDAHPNHLPLMIMVNTKQDRSPVPGGTDALPFDEAAFDNFDREVRSVLPPEKLVTPDVVQGRYPTLRAAVLAGNWPTLAQARGKIWFALDEGPSVVAVYRGKRRSLEGRVMFINTDEKSPAAAYLTLNEPLKDAARIRAAVSAGFMVRTRADANTVEARHNDTAPRDAALSGGAQYISTDYIWPDTRFSNYQVQLPGGAVALCNPVRAPGACGGMAVE